MKKTAFILAVLLCLAFAGCSNNTKTYSPSKPYWLNDANFGSSVDVSVNELCTYAVTYIEDESPNTAIKAEYSSIIYTTHVTADAYNDTPCYLLTSTMTATGKFTATGAEDGDSTKTTEFTDVTVSKTYFTWNNGITALFSEQNAQSTLPTSASATKDKHGNRFIKIAYKTTVEYSGNTATANFKMVGTDDEITKMAPYFALENNSTETYKKYNKTNYIDSNLLTFAVRSFDFADGLTYSFSSIDVLSKTKHSMVFSETEAQNATLKNCYINGTPQGLQDDNGDNVLSVPAYVISIRLNEKYSGNPMVCKYLINTGKYHHYMAEMTTTLPYGLGTLNYVLSSVTTY